MTFVQSLCSMYRKMFERELGDWWVQERDNAYQWSLCPLITLGRVVAFETCLHPRGGYTCDDTMASCYVLLLMALET